MGFTCNKCHESWTARFFLPNMMNFCVNCFKTNFKSEISDLFIAIDVLVQYIYYLNEECGFNRSSLIDRWWNS